MNQPGRRKSIPTTTRRAAVAVALAAAVGERAFAQLPASSSPPLPTDPIWYVTNRAPDGVSWRDERAGLSFGVRVFQVGDGSESGVLWSGRVSTNLVADSSRTGEDWLAGLGAAVQSGADAVRPVLLYVHGYGTSFNEATAHAAELRRRGDFDGPVVVFSWPSRGSGFAWPTIDHPLTNAYWRDTGRATESVPDLARVLGDLVRVIGAPRLVVSAHSLGNKLLDLALRDSTLAAQLAETPLRTLAFLSPDVDATYFADSTLVIARRLSARQVVYGARNDRVLAASSIVNGTPRAGRLDGAGLWPAGAEILDMTDAEIAGNWWTRHFGTNHALRRRPAAVLDLFRIVVPGMPDECRTALGLMARGPDGQWRLTRRSEAASGRAVPAPPCGDGAPLGDLLPRLTP